MCRISYLRKNNVQRAYVCFFFDYVCKVKQFIDNEMIREVW
jgi:hypothetical protein